jgi:hypothetical protein
MPAIRGTIIEPCAFERVESDLSIVLLGPGEVDRMMCTVEIPSPEDYMALAS